MTSCVAVPTNKKLLRLLEYFAIPASELFVYSHFDLTEL